MQIEFKQCTYVIHYFDGDVLFYSADLLLAELEAGRIRKAALEPSAPEDDGCGEGACGSSGADGSIAARRAGAGAGAGGVASSGRKRVKVKAEG